MPDLAEDIARRVAQNEARSVPAEGQTGYYLGVTGQSPFRYAFLQPPDEEIPRFAGSPDGERGAPIDSLVRNTDDHSLWINTDGDQAWQLVGSGSPFITDSYYTFGDDGTTTGNAYTSEEEIKWDTDSGFSNGSDITLVSGRVTIQTTGVYSIAATWDVGADTAADTYSYARGRFTLRRMNEPGSPVHDQVFLDDLKVPALNPSTNKHLAFFNCSIVAFMYAGDEVLVETIFTAGASPGSLWSYTNGSMYVERLS